MLSGVTNRCNFLQAVVNCKAVSTAGLTQLLWLRPVCLSFASQRLFCLVYFSATVVSETSFRLQLHYSALQSVEAVIYGGYCW